MDQEFFLGGQLLTSPTFQNYLIGLCGQAFILGSVDIFWIIHEKDMVTSQFS